MAEKLELNNSELYNEVLTRTVIEQREMAFTSNAQLNAKLEVLKAAYRKLEEENEMLKKTILGLDEKLQLSVGAYPTEIPSEEEIPDERPAT